MTSLRQLGSLRNLASRSRASLRISRRKNSTLWGSNSSSRSKLSDLDIDDVHNELELDENGLDSVDRGILGYDDYERQKHQELCVVEFKRRADKHDVEQVKRAIMANGDLIREILILPYQIKASMQQETVAQLYTIKCVKRVQVV